MTTIDEASVIRRAQNHLTTQLDGESIMMHMDTGMVYAMAETAHEIWQRLDEPVAFGKLVGRLVERFEVGRQTCESDAGASILEFRRLGVVEVDGTAQ